MINKEIYDKLVEYEHPLGTAYKANYVRALSSKALIDLDNLYQEMYHQSSRIRNGCGHCVLQDLRVMGKEYFDYKEQLEKIEIPEIKPMPVDPTIEWKEQVENETEPVDVTISESEDKPKRKGRKVTNKDNKN